MAVFSCVANYVNRRFNMSSWFRRYTVHANYIRHLRSVHSVYKRDTLDLDTKRMLLFVCFRGLWEQDQRRLLLRGSIKKGSRPLLSRGTTLILQKHKTTFCVKEDTRSICTTHKRVCECHTCVFPPCTVFHLQRLNVFISLGRATYD